MLYFSSCHGASVTALIDPNGKFSFYSAETADGSNPDDPDGNDDKEKQKNTFEYLRNLGKSLSKAWGLITNCISNTFF